MLAFFLLMMLGISLGLSGIKDAQPLNERDQRGIDIFITIDGNIEYRQQFINRKFGTVVIRSVLVIYALFKTNDPALPKSSAGNIPHIR